MHMLISALRSLARWPTKSQRDGTRSATFQESRLPTITGSLNNTISRTLRIALEPGKAGDQGPETPTPKRTYRNPIFLAREWQAMINCGRAKSRADLASKLGLSRARVNQFLRLPTLAPEVIEVVDRLGDPMPYPIITERFLRSISGLNDLEQMRRVERRVLERTPRTTERPQTSEQESPKSGVKNRRGV